jgi:hypothetical protein
MIGVENSAAVRAAQRFAAVVAALLAVLALIALLA